MTILAHIPLNWEETSAGRSKKMSVQRAPPGKGKSRGEDPAAEFLRSCDEEPPTKPKGTARGRPPLTPRTPASLQETHNANSESSQGTRNADAGLGTADPAEATGEGKESSGEGKSDEEDVYDAIKTVIREWYLKEWGRMLDTLPDYTSEELEEMVQFLLRNPDTEEYIREIWKHHCTPSQWQQLQTREREIRQTLQADVTHSREQARGFSGDFSEKNLGAVINSASGEITSDKDYEMERHPFLYAVSQKKLSGVDGTLVEVLRREFAMVAERFDSAGRQHQALREEHDRNREEHREESRRNQEKADGQFQTLLDCLKGGTTADLDKSTEDLPSEKNVPSRNRVPVSFSPDPGVPVDGVGYLRGTTSGRATVPDLSGPRDRAIALRTPDSVMPVRAADSYWGSGPITVFSQKMPPIEYFSGKGGELSKNGLACSGDRSQGLRNWMRRGDFIMLRPA